VSLCNKSGRHVACVGLTTCCQRAQVRGYVRVLGEWGGGVSCKCHLCCEQQVLGNEHIWHLNSNSCTSETRIHVKTPQTTLHQPQCHSWGKVWSNATTPTTERQGSGASNIATYSSVTYSANMLFYASRVLPTCTLAWTLLLELKG
jgi:hypothetical protein